MSFISLFKKILVFLLSFALSYCLTNIVKSSLNDKSMYEIKMPSYTRMVSSDQYVDTINWQKISNREVLPTKESAVYRAYLSLSKYEGKAASKNRYHVVLCDNSWIIQTSKGLGDMEGGGHYFEIDKISGRINVSLGLK